MQLDEAVAIQQHVMKGIPVLEEHLRQANRVIKAHMGFQGENRSWAPEPVSAAQRERVNLILLARLGLACRKFDTWRTT